jgi:hypothetical protein
MITIKAQIGSYAVEVWADTNPALAVSQDSWLLTELPGDVVRVAALDGVTPVVEGEWRLGLDQAAWAAQMTRAALHADKSLESCLLAAHEAVFDAAIVPYRNRPQTGVVAADVRSDGTVQVAALYDCEAWVRSGDIWSEIPGGDMLIPSAQASFSDLVARKAELTRKEFNRAETELLSDPAMWSRKGVGQFDQITPVVVEVSECDEIVLATDGGLLDEDRLARLPEWLAELRAWEQQAKQLGRFKKTDDVTVLRVRRSDAC